ncbi:uncharacterized protein LOC121425174 [Lytechinus variegatus]|uniref:uncharacterized protein LOC121425174 n=1 Tax=Lytechinus variegatus TaxID=7654 RepID=UPI001BB21318|nr:uncharacterized protein LOC121425174 [Lytechinus variegatus]XP_041477111.1 uncharacterized protein LOC121425174 [Lytechinus variegatus]
MEGKVFKEPRDPEVVPESERDKRKDCSAVRLKEIKIVLRDIQTPKSAWPGEHLQSLCETCKPREIHELAAKSDVKYKRGNRRKSCDELLNCWKAPTRNHRLPKRLQDFVVDRTVLHLIEFSNWYNMGRVARHCNLTVKSKPYGVPKPENSPHKGSSITSRICQKEQISHDNEKVMRPASKTTTKHRGRPKKQLNAARTVTEGLHKRRGRPKKCEDEVHTLTVPSSKSALIRPMGKCKSLKKMKLPKSPVSVKSNRGMISRKSQDSQISEQVSKRRGRPKKCQDVNHGVPISQSTPANHQTRNKRKCLGDSQQTMPVSQSCLITSKPRGRHTKCKDLQEIVTVSHTGSGSSRLRGRPKRSKDASKSLLISVSSCAQPKHQGQSDKLKGVNKMPSGSTAAGPKQLSRPRNKRKLQKTVTSSSKSDSPVLKCRGRQSKCSVLLKDGKINSEHKIPDNAEQFRKCCIRSRKQKFGVFSSKQNLLASSGSTRGLVNPDFSIDENNPCTLNINEYLTQLGSYLEPTDHCETTAEGNVSESREGLHICDENNNIIIMDSDALQETSPSQCNRGISDEGTISTRRKEGRDESQFGSGSRSLVIDTNNNLTIERNINMTFETNQNLITEANNNFVTETNNNMVTDANNNLVIEANNNVSIETIKNLVTEANNNLVTDANNNLVIETNTNQTNDTGKLRSDSGISDISFDAKQVSKPKRSRRTQEDKVQPRSSSLNLRRSERLRLKESYQRYKQLWTDTGICKKSENYSQRESSINQEKLESTLDDDLLHEFVAMCPLESDIPLSDNDCFSLLAESPIFTGIELGSLSGFDMPIEEETGSKTVDVIHPRTPPRVKRNICEFLLNERSICSLADQLIHSPHRGPGGGGEVALQGCRDPTRAWKMGPGFGPLVEWQVLILRKIGLEMTGELEDVGRSHEMNDRSQSKRSNKMFNRSLRRSVEIVNRPLSWSDGIEDRSQSTPVPGNVMTQESDRRGPQNMPRDRKFHSRKDQRIGVQEILKLAHHGSPLLVFIHPGGQKSYHAVAEVWLPSFLVESNTNSVFFMPMGEWDAIEKWWCIQKVLWKSRVDGSWHVISVAEEEFMDGTCFVPEESWLGSQGVGDQTSNRIYHVRQPPRGPGMFGCPCPGNPSRTLYLSSDQEALEKNLRKQKQQHSVSIPPVCEHDFLQPCTACHLSVLCPQVMATSAGFNHVPNTILGNTMPDLRPRLVPVFDQPQEHKSCESLTACSVPGYHHLPDPVLQGVFQHQGSNIYGTTAHQVTNGHFIGLNGYMAASHDHNYDTRSDILPLGRPYLAESMVCDGCSDDLGLEKTVLAGKTKETTNLLSDQSTHISHNNDDNGHHELVGHGALLLGNQSSYPVKDNNSNTLQTELPDKSLLNDQESRKDINNDCGPVPLQDINKSNDLIREKVIKTPSSLSKALDQIKACEDVSLVGKLLSEWCRSGLSFRRDRKILETVARRLEMGACYQSSQSFCTFVAGFHAASLKSYYSVDYDDECILVQLGLSVVSRCLNQEQNGNQSKDQVVPVQDDPHQSQNQPVHLLDQPHKVNTHQSPEVQDRSLPAKTLSIFNQDQCSLAQLLDQPSYNTPSSEDENLIQIQEELGTIQTQDQTMQVQGKQGAHVVETLDQTTQISNSLWLPETQEETMQVPTEARKLTMQIQDHSGTAETQDKTIMVQEQAMQVQDHVGTTEIQDESMQIQDQPIVVNPREDAYCVLQMLHHLKLPLTEVLASLSDVASQDASPGFLHGFDCSSTVRDVLGVLADFDPSMAFTVVQGLGWGHTVREISKEDRSFGSQLLALAEALLDCKKFWQCRVLLSNLIAYDGCRDACKQLYSNLLGKILDTERDDELAMMVFEEMMESYLVIPPPIIRKLLTIMWQRKGDDRLEDALCVFHYGMGLGIYPMYRNIKTDLWESTVMVGATHAEIYFCLKTLLDEVHHQQSHQDGQVKDAGQRDGAGIGANSVVDVGRDLILRKSARFAGKGRCGARKQSVPQMKGTPRLLKKKGRTVPSACYVLPKDQPRGMRKSRPNTKVNIKLMDLQRGQQHGILSSEEFSKLVNTKYAIQEVLENHFHALTIKPDALPWNSNRRKKSYTLTINEDALHSWLSSKGRSDTP